MPTNFIDSNTTITTALPKVNLRPPTGLATNNLADTEINALIQAVNDTRTVIQRTVSVMSYGADSSGVADSTGSLNAAAAALSSGGTIHLPAGTYNVSNITIPANITLSFDSSQLSVPGGQTVAINGAVDAPATQIFSGAGTVTFGGTQASHELNVKWWGAKGDGVTPDHVAIQAALTAAAQQANALNSVAVTGGATDWSFPGVTVRFPPGQYLVGVTLEQGYGVNIKGTGTTALSPTSALISTLPILRSAGPYTSIEDVRFAGGLHAIVMFGQLANGGYSSPTAYGVLPMRLTRCSFVFQRGPAIWQDCSPSTTVNGTQVLTAGTPASLTVVDASHFTHFAPGAANLQILSNGVVYLCDFATASGTTFTGVNIKSAITLKTGASFTPTSVTFSTGNSITHANQSRTFQAPLYVTDFHFIGPCLFWGSGDTVVFDRGVLSPDWVTVGFPTSADGLPLGLFNSGDQVTISNCTVDPNGGPATARTAFFVGAGFLRVLNTHSTDLTQWVMVRTRTIANAYQGAAASPIAIASGGSASFGTVDFHGFEMINAVSGYWLECYDYMPQQVRMDVGATQNDVFQGTYGVWVDSTLNLETALQDQVPNLMGTWTGTNHADVFSAFVFRQGTDPGAGANPAKTAGVDVSPLMAAFIQYPERTKSPAALLDVKNYMPAGCVSAGSSGVSFVAPGNTGSPTDTTTGYSLLGATGAAYINLNLPAVGGALPAGVYCFSAYVKTDSDLSVIFSSQYSTGTGGAQLGFQRVYASGNFQRISIPVYLPGGGVTCTLGVNAYNLPGGSNNFYAGMFQLNRGPVPSPYLYPGNDTALVLGTMPQQHFASSIPTTGTWKVGDIVFNTAPASAGYIGWVCTVAGAPGTWKTFGLIS